MSGQIQDQATLFESVEGGNHVGQNNPVFIMTNKTVPYKKNIDEKTQPHLTKMNMYCNYTVLVRVISSLYHNW